MIEAVAIDDRQVRLQSVDLASDRIEHAAAKNSPALAFFRRASRTEHAIENYARTDFHRQRRVTIGPRDTVHVSARVTPAAGPFRPARILDTELDGRQQRVLTDFFGDLLIGRGHADVNVQTRGFLHA